MLTLEQALKVLKKTKKIKDGYLACCPAHDDDSPSLSISEGEDGKLLLNCYAGCSFDTVVSALNSQSCETSQYISKSAKPFISKLGGVQYYHYCSTEGVQTLRVCRQNYSDGTKKIWQQKFKDDTWVSGTPSVRVLPYRFELWKNERKVYLVEGEKCADELIKNGLFATTVPGGAGAWHKSYAEHFKDKCIIFIPDNDRPGRTFITNAYNDIKHFSKELKIIELSGIEETQDIFDWLNNGGSIEKLKNIEQSLDSAEATLARWRTRTPVGFHLAANIEEKEISFLWYPYIPFGKITILAGDGGVGKSTLISSLLADLSRGNSIHETKNINSPLKSVLFTSEEDPADSILPRLRKLNANLNQIGIYSDPIDFSKSGFDLVKDIIENFEPSLIVFDPIQSYIGRIDMHRANEVRSTLDPLIKIARDRGCAIVLVAHLNKSNAKAEYRTLGSVDFIAVCRSLLIVGKSQTDERKRALFHKKSNCGPYGEALGYKISDTGHFTWIGKTDLTEYEALGAELKTINTQPQLSFASELILNNLDVVGKSTQELCAVAQEANVSKRTFERALKELETQGQTYKKDNLWFIGGSK